MKQENRGALPLPRGPLVSAPPSLCIRGPNSLRLSTLHSPTVDKVLESCFQLISLFFMTIGRTSEVPAAYALTSTIKRLLDHLTEANLYSAKDLESMSQTLDTLSRIIRNADSEHSPYLVELLAKRVELCKSMLSSVKEKLDVLEKPLPAIHEKLISILRTTALANTKTKASFLTSPSVRCLETCGGADTVGSSVP